MRFWLWGRRENHSYRPCRPLTPLEETKFVWQLRKVLKEVHINLFLEVELGLDLRPIAPPEKTKDDILLFFKLYDPLKEELRYVGRLFVKLVGKPSEILMKLNEMAGYGREEEIVLYEEIKFEPSVMCEPVDKELSYAESQLEDGDIICFQKALRFPDVPSYLRHKRNRRIATFEKPVNIHNQETNSNELSSSVG
ncbi:ubiquitin carboxyl-terminal hydrolase 13 isoform X2 [Neltuma alba]|uniref:ubiquitin carboxyl-terminal hydrolase 13 isoform X1 n=1 Tax=Neltuma alba TaxID=207710 RepID=UPI0010A5773B|nr:ubiquitin carboxyl-terminal hydrolase 13-like isoform X1 [Prosopis alba]XP_028758703.1 ubiquitin carboxyl-terminal hydrolase 13-like isoform X2 [Prosopis alba]